MANIRCIDGRGSSYLFRLGGDSQALSILYMAEGSCLIAGEHERSKKGCITRPDFLASGFDLKK